MSNIKRVLFLLIAIHLYCIFSEKLYLTVAYCPTLFTAGGALVNIDIATGNYTVINKFKWPHDIQFQGCGGPAFVDPTITYNPNQDVLYMDFIDNFGALVEFQMKDGTSKSIKPSDPFFVGYNNIAYVGSNTIKGMTPTVEEDGFCSDGCFAFGKMDTSTGKYNKLADVPFKEMADDSHYFDSDKNVFFMFKVGMISEKCLNDVHLLIQMNVY
jgi:hypothetical protein